MIDDVTGVTVESWDYGRRTVQVATRPSLANPTVNLKTTISRSDVLMETLILELKRIRQ